MNNPQRYSSEDGCLFPDEHGDWVKFSDVQSLAASETGLTTEPRWDLNGAPASWPYAEREAWKGGYYAAMLAFRDAWEKRNLEANRHNVSD